MATMYAKFDGKCQRCGCRFPAGTLIDFVRGAGASHATAEACETATAARAAAPAPPVVNLQPVADFITAAKGRGVARPILRVVDVDGRGELTLSLTKGGLAPGSIAVKRNGDFIGCIRPTGETTGQVARETALQAHLQTLAADPVTAAQTYAKLSSNCSFCGARLSDDREGSSVEVGYGPKCAKNWGLPHHPKGKSSFSASVAREVVEYFAAKAPEVAATA